jgi:hypothetical protein
VNTHKELDSEVLMTFAPFINGKTLHYPLNYGVWST